MTLRTRVVTALLLNTGQQALRHLPETGQIQRTGEGLSASRFEYRQHERSAHCLGDYAMELLKPRFVG